jgi:hypothetical protein
MVRNNVFDDSGSGQVAALFWAQRNPLVPTPDDVRVYNNTLYRGTAATDVSGLLLTDSTASNLRLRNNLIGVSSASNVQLFQGTPGAGFQEDHNLVTAAAGFVGAGNGNLALDDGSPAVNAGAALPEVRRDYLGAARPVGGGYDLGAFESH